MTDVKVEVEVRAKIVVVAIPRSWSPADEAAAAAAELAATKLSVTITANIAIVVVTRRVINFVIAYICTFDVILAADTLSPPPPRRHARAVIVALPCSPSCALHDAPPYRLILQLSLLTGITMCYKYCYRTHMYI